MFFFLKKNKNITKVPKPKKYNKVNFIVLLNDLIRIKLN